ncbi:MAG: hypothetical protein H0X64_13370, partial [Gemmatimonadaceae bacterium]|nr:hypothetical protein [Gemmatimonadaceae bacterium]
AGAGNTIVLSTNGKPDASMAPSWTALDDSATPRMMLDSDMGTQVLLALTTLAHAPEARVAAVIGQGSGVTSHFMLASPSLAHLSTIEIEPQIIEASRHFLPFNQRVFTDPRAQFVVDDAKSYFASAGRTYDVILSEPSNPWVSGVSGLFTDEFYRRVRTHLSPDGVFGQWLHLYEIDDTLVLSILAAIDRNFEDYAIYGTAGMDILVVAKPRGKLPAPAWEAVTSWPMVQQDLARALPLTPAALERTLVLSREVMHPMLSTIDQPNSDYQPVLDLGAEKMRFLRRSAAGLVSIGRSRFDLPRALAGDPLPFSTSLESGLSWTRAIGATRGAQLRAARDGKYTAPAGSDELGRAQYDVALVDALVASPAPPADWRAWFATVATAEERLHLGTAGVADERFWAPVLAYAARHQAPRELQASLDLLYGAAAWDWQRVLRAEGPLAEAQLANRAWANPEMLRDAVVAAHLRQGDPAAARRSLGRLTLPSRSTDPAYNFRTQLLFWYIADRAGSLDPDP